MGLFAGLLLGLSGVLGRGTGLGVQNVIPDSEGGGVVADEMVVVFIVVVCSCPEEQKVMQGDWELVPRMGVDGLEQSQGDPDGNGEQMQVLCEVAPHDRNTNSTEPQEHHLNRVCVFCSQAKWSSVSVMLLVDVFVEVTVVQASVEPVMPGVLQKEEDSHLQRNGLPRWEWDLKGNADLLADWMEEPDREGLDQEMRLQNRL